MQGQGELQGKSVATFCKDEAALVAFDMQLAAFPMVSDFQVGGLRASMSWLWWPTLYHVSRHCGHCLWLMAPKAFLRRQAV